MDSVTRTDNREVKRRMKKNNHDQWIRSRDDLIRALISLGFPEELGHAIAKHLGSPKAIDRMTAYEIDAWKEKKASEEANMTYNEMLYRGWDTEEDE